MPDPIIPDPNDLDASLASAGLDPESFSLRDTDAFYSWAADHPEWMEWSDYGLSHEGIVGLWAAGLDPSDAWTGLTISADGTEWSVDITTESGYVFHIPIGEGFDIAWDYYDAAGYFDIDIEKDIDTGSTED